MMRLKVEGRLIGAPGAPLSDKEGDTIANLAGSCRLP